MKRRKKKKDSVEKTVSSDSERDDGQTKQRKIRSTEVGNIDVVGASGGALTTEEDDYVEVSTSSLSSSKKKKKKSPKKKTG